MQRSSQRGTPQNIELKDTRLTPDLDEYPIETPNYDPIATPENNDNTLTLPQSVPHAQESTAIEGVCVSEVIKNPYSKGV